MPETISRDELRQVLERGDAVVLVEALPTSSFDEGHLPGAVNVPHDAPSATVETALPQRDAAIVVYCASQACQNSVILSRRLEQLGYANVREYAGGKEHWVEAGLPVEGATTKA